MKINLFKIAYNTFTILVSLIALFLIVSIFPIVGNYKVLVVKSGSMEPALKMGSIIISKSSEIYSANDIITFKSGKTLITHRIFKIDQENKKQIYTTKGDANKGEDKNKITKDKIVGKVILTVPYVGYAIDTAKKPIGFVLIIVLPALIIIFDELKKIFEEVRIKKLNE